MVVHSDLPGFRKPLLSVRGSHFSSIFDLSEYPVCQSEGDPVTMILRPGKLLIRAFHHCSEKEGKPKKPKSHAKSCLLLSPKGGGESKDRSRAFPKNPFLSFAPRQCRILLPNLPLRSRRRFTELGLEANKIESTAIAATNMRTQPHHWSKHHMVTWSWKQEIDTSDGMAKECNRFLQCWTGTRHGYTIWSKVLSEMFKVYTIEIKTPIGQSHPHTHTYKEWRRNMNGQWA